MLHIYCYNKFEDRLKALDYAPKDHKLWKECDLTGGSDFLYPSKEAADLVIELYNKGSLNFFVTANNDILSHILSYIVDEEPLLPHKIFWFDSKNDTFQESVLTSEGDLNNWPFGYLY